MEDSVLREMLAGTGVKLRTAKETDSTNSDAARAFRKGEREILLLTADRQSAGRGRCGKSFLSPEGGLYMTLLLPEERPLPDITGVTPSAAVAVRRAIRNTCGVTCGIKWVNDLYLDDRKLCGILCESVNTPDGQTSRALVIGVGINLAATPEVTDSEVRSASLAEKGVLIDPLFRERLCAAAVRELLKAGETGFAFSACAEEYRRASLVLGREITFTRNGVSRTGRAVRIDDGGRLIVRCGDETAVLDSGEIHVRLS